MIRRRAIAGAGLLVILAAGCGERAPDAAARPPRGSESVVGIAVCAECHEEATEIFHGSDHDLAMQPVSEETVLGDFEDASFTHRGVTSTFHRRDNAYFVRTDGPDGAMREYRIDFAFGVRPLQQYLVEIEPGRYQVLSLCWDTRSADDGGQRWFHLYPDEPIDHLDELHWTRPLGNWNYMCAECHSTKLDKGYIAAEDRYETMWEEIDVSCEACHGAGADHVAWAREVEAGAEPGDADYGLVVRLKVPDEAHWIFDEDAPTAHRAAPLAANVQVETCGRCHSRRTQVWPEYHHGDQLADTHRVSLLEERLYHADGQILDEVYVYGSFLQSRMYHNGVTCTDCHEPHGGGLWAPGNALCARCHVPEVYDTEDHHFHPVDSTGALCVECHMVDRNYMVVDPRRDHSMRIPRPDLTVEIGTPNACTRCHDDEPAQWSAEKVVEWYGREQSDQPHYGEALRAGRRGLPGALAKLLGVIGDDEMPAIVRATAVELLRRYPHERTLPAIRSVLEDDAPLVRRAAAGLLEVLPPDLARSLGEPLLSDPIRTVRLEAVAVLAGVLRESPEQPGAFDRAVEEYRVAQRFNADRAEGRLNLGNLEMRLGLVDAAERAYRGALAIQPDFAPAVVNLADLLRATGRDAAAERVLRESLAAGEDAGVHHALGLLLVRRRQATAALEHLAAAARARPDAVRYAYVYAIALHDLGDAPRAITVLEQAHREQPGDRDVLAALVTYSREMGRHEDAERWAARLRTLTER
ncbi:MAG: tetratricopeptide repeat protein [Planctomycetes bacterium]|nr:tetratricopeptide repeat protein [Planctomycetota bacterium]